MTVRVRVRLHATFRAAVGRRDVDVTVDPGSTVADVLARLEANHPEITGELVVDGAVPATATVLKNGRLIDRETPGSVGVDADDELTVTPPVSGGDT